MTSIVRPRIDLDAKRTEIQNSIDQMYIDFLQEESRIDDQKQRLNRNILLIGLSKSGKTTLGRVLNDPRYISEELSLRSSADTKLPFQSILTPTTVPIVLNIVELPEQMISTTDDLSKIHDECTRLHIHDFHLIGLCLSFDAGIDGTAVKSFERFLNHFGHEKLKPNLCLIITRCESKNANQRQRLCSEAEHDVDFRKITQNLGRGIHFSGALNRDNWNAANESLYEQFRTVYEYRKNLLQLIAEDIEPFHIESPSTPQIHQTSYSKKQITEKSPTTQQPTSTSVYRENQPSSQVTAVTPSSSDQTPSTCSCCTPWLSISSRPDSNNENHH